MSASVDLDIDSDNTDALNQPDQTPQEEAIEESHALPGKLLSLNAGDINANEVPDFADGILIFDSVSGVEIWGHGGNGASAPFVPVVFTIKNAEAAAKLRFSYPACDPKKLFKDVMDAEIRDELGLAAGDPGYFYQLQNPALPDLPGSLRLWRKNGGQERRADGINVVRNGIRGDFIDTETSYSFADFGITNPSGTVTVTLYLEAVKLSQTLADQTILLSILDADDNFIGCDTVNATVLDFGIRTDDFEVSADDVFCPLTAFTNLPGLSTRWTLMQGVGLGFANPLAGPDANGSVNNEFQMSGVAGVQYRVNVKIVGFAPGEDWFDGPEFLTGRITVVPGLCNNVDITRSVPSLPADGQSTMDLTATFSDQFGNHIEPGSPVTWLLAGLGNLVVGSCYADSLGKVHATLTAGDIPGNQSLWIEADGHGFDVLIENTPVVISLATATSAPTSLDVTTDASTILRATFASVKDGTPIRWFTTNGQLSNASATVVGNVATALLKATGAHVRDALVTVGFGNVMRGLIIPFTSPSPGPTVGNYTPALSVDFPVLAGDTAAAQPSVEVERIDGTLQTVQVQRQTSVTLRAPDYRSYPGSPAKYAQLEISQPTLVEITDGTGLPITEIPLDSLGNATFMLRSKAVFTPSASQRAVSVNLNVTFEGDEIHANGFTLQAVVLAGQSAVAIQSAALDHLKVSEPSPRAFSIAEKNGAQFQLFSILAGTNQLHQSISLVPAGDMVDRANYAYRTGLWKEQTPTTLSATNRVMRAAYQLPDPTSSEKQGFLEQISRATFKEIPLADSMTAIASLDALTGDPAFEGIVRLVEDHTSWPIILGTTATSPDDLHNIGRLSHRSVFGEGRGDQVMVRRMLYQLQRLQKSPYLHELGIKMAGTALEAVETFLRGLINGKVRANVPAGIYPDVASVLGYLWGAIRETLETALAAGGLAMNVAKHDPITYTMAGEILAFTVALSNNDQAAWDHLKRMIPIMGTYLTGSDAWDKYKVGDTTVRFRNPVNTGDVAC